jgi:uncharacterized DUF497 family protein
MRNLTAKQLRAAEAIASADTIIDAAAACGVHRCTLHKWIAMPEFAAALEDMQREARARAVRRLSAALDRAAQTVISLAETSEDEAIRLRAAIAVPAMLREVLEVEAAVTAAQTEARAITIEYVNDWRKVPTVFVHDDAVRAIAARSEAAQPVE